MSQQGMHLEPFVAREHFTVLERKESHEAAER
jgi:hypothetical protein